MILQCVKSFKRFRCDMMTFRMKTVDTDKALESYISEILETLEKDWDDWWLLQTKFFH